MLGALFCYPFGYTLLLLRNRDDGSRIELDLDEVVARVGIRIILELELELLRSARFDPPFARHSLPAGNGCW